MDDAAARRHAATEAIPPPPRSTTTTTADCGACPQVLYDILIRTPSSSTMATTNDVPLLHRPRAILQAMAQMTSTPTTPRTLEPRPLPLPWQITSDGVAIAIPAASPWSSSSTSRSMLRRWTRLVATSDADTTMTVNDPDVAPFSDARRTLHSSSTTLTRHPTTPSAVPSSSSPASAARPAASWEWLRVSCRACARDGPEGGARAFVMGPTPLSIVICTNRLVHRSDHRLAPPVTEDPTATAMTPPHRPSLASLFASPLHREIAEILTHELVHIYDVRMLALDLRDCESLAYSEVRAALAAECSRHSTAVPTTRTSTFPPPSDPPRSFIARATPAASSWRWRSAFSSTSPDHHAPLSSPLIACVRHHAVTATANLFPSPTSRPNPRAAHCVDQVLRHALRHPTPWQPPPPPSSGAVDTIDTRGRTTTSSSTTTTTMPSHSLTTTTTTTTPSL